MFGLFVLFVSSRSLRSSLTAVGHRQHADHHSFCHRTTVTAVMARTASDQKNKNQFASPFAHLGVLAVGLFVLFCWVCAVCFLVRVLTGLYLSLIWREHCRSLHAFWFKQDHLYPRSPSWRAVKKKRKFHALPVFGYEDAQIIGGAST